MSKLLRSIRQKDKLAPLLNAYFAAGEFPDEMPATIHPNKPPDKHYHPSSAGECARHSFALRVGDVKPEPISGSLQRIFHVGHLYHAWIQFILVDMGLAEPSAIEKKYKRDLVTDAGNKWRMTGATDVARCSIAGHGDYLVDIKTMGGFSFKQENMRPDMWYKYHSQIQVYMDWHDMDQALILGVNKDTPHDFREWEIKRDPSVADAVYEKWETVADAVVADLPPNCTCSDPTACPVRGLYVTK